jgi:inorganic pyrophosphatase
MLWLASLIWEGRKIGPRVRALTYLAGSNYDPVDMLVLMDEPAFPGCLVNCRVIGIIEAEQGEKKDLERNDRIVAIEKNNHTYSFINHIDDLGKEFVKELEEFFVNYHKLTGEKYRILDVKGPGEARRRIRDGM